MSDEPKSDEPREKKSESANDEAAKPAEETSKTSDEKATTASAAAGSSDEKKRDGEDKSKEDAKSASDEKKPADDDTKRAASEEESDEDEEDDEGEDEDEKSSGPPSHAPKAPRFEPAKPKRRDWLLTLVPALLLFALMSFRGDVMNPRGEDPARPLGHYSTLLHSGHIPGGVIIGAVLVAMSAVGILGLLGDSPLDLRGDEIRARLALPKGKKKPGEKGASDEGEETNTEPERRWYQREGVWLVLFAGALFLPLAGAYGLWDPWETHYSEVAREILARDDWITLWWGQEGWFMSKPILIFWMSALGMGLGSTFGLPFWRDMVPSHHEWFIRVPIGLFAIAAVYSVYKAVSMAWGRRAGLLCGAVLATMPHFFFLSHQAMTDMPFVAPLIVAMAVLMMAVVVDPERVARARAVTVFGRTFRVSLWHVALGAVLLVSLPQVVYLLSRPVMLSCPDEADRSCQAVLESSRIGPIQFPIERYWYGSAGNSVLRDGAASIPGSPAWEDRYNQIPFAPSFVQGLLWLAIGTGLLLSFRKERRMQSLYFVLLYVFSAISFMGKGPAGLGVPEIVLLGFMMTTGKWQLVTRLRIIQGAAIFFICGMPWYIAIYCRLGNEFFDRFVVHDLLNRAFAGVHGDTGTFRYFIWQLGYAMFPWTGLVPAALLGWKLWVPERATEAQRDIARLALLWFLVTFTLFSLMVTKFHHYIFPTVPSCALLVGLLVHRMMGEKRLKTHREVLQVGGALFAGIGAAVVGVANFFGAWHGQVSRVAPFELPPGNKPVGAVLVGLGVAAIYWSFVQAKKSEEAMPDASLDGATEKGLFDPLAPVEEELVTAPATDEVGAGYRRGAKADEPEGPAVVTGYDNRYVAAGLGAAAIGAFGTIALIARDIGYNGSTRPVGFERFIHLFIYNYERPFPTRSYDYHAILSGFGIVAVVVVGSLILRSTRRHGARALLALAACFGFWALDKYMIDLSNHWSQRNLFEAYARRREVRTNPGSGEDGRYWHDALVAFQMNWKGENFYTGNHAAMLECGLPFCRERTPEWLRRHQGQRVFFVTEHSRANSIIGQVRNAHGTAETVTNEYDNNKFVLIEAHL